MCLRNMRENQRVRKIVNYFKKNIRKGYTGDSLKWALMRQGYSRVLVENSLKQAEREMSEKAPELKDKPIIKHEFVDHRNKPIKINYKKPLWKKFLSMFK